MKDLTRFMAAIVALVTLCWTTAEAQTVLKMPKEKAGPTADAGSIKNAASSYKNKEVSLQNDYRSPWALSSADEKVVYSAFVQDKGSKPTLSPSVSATVRKSSESATTWTYTGFNSAAGVDESGNTTGGLVNFNLEPFTCDTVSSDAGLSPYSYMAKGKLYCFLPVQDSSGSYVSITRTIYDANTLEVLDSRSFDNPTGETSYVPYMLTYDDQRDVVYSISLEDATDRGYSGNNYYLNILDTATCRLQRVGYLGSYWGYQDKGNYNPKGFVAGYGTLYVQLLDDSVYMAKIDPNTCETTVIGRTELPTQYVYGLQPMVYDSSAGSLLVNHYNFNDGTVFYKVSPFVAYGSQENICNTVLVEKASTGFTYFYKRPETETSYYEYQLDDISDFTATVAEGSNDVSISFTIPSTVDGGNELVLPSWASDVVRLYFYVDGTYVTADGVPSQPKLGDKVECTISGLTSGMHIIVAQVYPLYTSVNSIRNSKTIVCGYDAPAEVGDPTLTIENQVATITWTAPTKGLYDDFGSTFDASDITYTVVRDVDGTVVAEGITETTVTDSNLPGEITTHTYTIYASSHGTSNRGATTNAVTAGLYMPLPYENNFSSVTDFDGWTVHNLNNDGTARTWTYNSYNGYVTCSGSSYCEDWLMSPAFSLKTDSLYMFSYNVMTSYDATSSLKTTLGKGTTVESQTTVLDDRDGFTTENFETARYYVIPEEEGYYNMGLFDYGVGTSYVAIDTVIVKAVASVDAPDKVSGIEITADAGGALGATLTFTLPTTDMTGKQISSLTKVTAYDLKGNALATSSEVTPGGKVTLHVDAAHGNNTFSIVAANENGEGWPVEVSKYIGLDQPMAITDLITKWGEEQNVAVLSWTNPTEGVHGGYVNPDAFTYTIYKYDSSSYPAYTKLGETSGESEIEVMIMDASENQDQYVFAVTVSNEEGESDYVKSGLVMGTPYTLPFVEAFASEGVDHSPYLLGNGINDQTWTIDGGYYNYNIQPYDNDGAQLLCLNTGSSDGSGYFISPIISFENATKPYFSFWLHHSDAMSDKAYIKVMASTDGSKNYVAIGDSITLTGNNGWQEHIVDLSELNGKKAQVALYGYMPDPATRIFADNWNIYEATGKDLAVTGITQPYMPVVGDTATITVTVVNKGASEAADYSVLFNVNDVTVSEAMAEKPLAAGAQTTFSFTLPITAGNKNVLYNAEVIYDGDENEDNNLSTDVELDPISIDLAAPTSLTLSGDDNLAWIAPETTDGREVLLDFESVPAFMTDDIAGWKTIDLDGNLTTSFIQYYDNYWPYCNQPLAWMTWSAQEAGCPTSTIWLPYEGEKCLIHWGNYGSDADGRTNDTPDDDWFISPEIKGGSAFSFMTLSNATTSSIEVLTSSTTDEPEAFTNRVTAVDYSTISVWKEVSVTLPEDAKYVAIHTVLDDFGIMIDNINYTEAKSPVLLGYNVYCGNAVESSVATTGAKAANNGTYAVSAVYDLGESDLSNTVSVTTGIADLQAADVTVTSGEGIVTVKGADGKQVEVFGVNGLKVAGSKAKAVETYSVNKGVYIVTVDSKTYKLVVK